MPLPESAGLGIPGADPTSIGLTTGGGPNVPTSPGPGQPQGGEKASGPPTDAPTTPSGGGVAPGGTLVI